MARSLADPIQRLMILMFKAHPWHGVSIGEKAPDGVTAYMEIVPTDTVKYEVDKETGYLKIDRPQQYSNVVPANYGFIPQTYCPDGDPLDILVLSQQPLAPLSIARARPIGVMKMRDEKGEDDKIVCVPTHDQ